MLAFRFEESSPCSIQTLQKPLHLMDQQWFLTNARQKHFTLRAFKKTSQLKNILERNYFIPSLLYKWNELKFIQSQKTVLLPFYVICMLKMLYFTRRLKKPIIGCLTHICPLVSQRKHMVPLAPGHCEVNAQMHSLNMQKSHLGSHFCQ